MKVTRNHVLEVYSVLNVINKKDMKPKGAYGVCKNKTIAEAEVKFIQEAQQKIQQPEGLKEFEEKRIAKCVELSLKDENGNPVIVNKNRYNIPEENQKELDAAINELRETYKEAFDKSDEIKNQFQELLDEEIEVNFHKMKVEWLPEQITGDQMEVLMDLIDEG